MVIDSVHVTIINFRQLITTLSFNVLILQSIFDNGLLHYPLMY